MNPQAKKKKKHEVMTITIKPQAPKVEVTVAYLNQDRDANLRWPKGFWTSITFGLTEVEGQTEEQYKTIALEEAKKYGRDCVGFCVINISFPTV